MYLRGFRRYADFSTGIVAITRGTMKRLIEFIPDRGSHEGTTRVRDISTDYIRARIQELERAGLIAKQEKKSRFDAPAFCCVLMAHGSLRPEYEPPMNPQRGTPSEKPVLTLVSAQGTPNEPPGMNPHISGNPVIQEEAKASLSPDAVASSDGAPVSSCPHQEIIALYHELLPELKSIVPSRWSGSKDAKALQARWREDRRHRSLDFWKRLFLAVRTNGFWMGNTGWDGCNLRWLVQRSNFDKAVDLMVNNANRGVTHG